MKHLRFDQIFQSQLPSLIQTIPFSTAIQRVLYCPFSLFHLVFSYNYQFVPTTCVAQSINFFSAVKCPLNKYPPIHGRH